MKNFAFVAVAALFASSLPLVAQQDARSGVSTPPPATSESNPVAADEASTPGYQPTPPPLPALQTRSTAESSIGGYETGIRTKPSAAKVDVDGEVVPSAETFDAIPRKPAGAELDLDARVVTSVPHAPNECPIGTRLKIRMGQTLSSRETAPGTLFSGSLIESVRQDGRVLIPAGSILEGKVTAVHGGKRIGGRAALHLEARKLILPDGTSYLLYAQVIDTDQNFATKVDNEGTIVRRDHVKTALAVVGGAAGTGAVAGAVLGGGVGAVVGAGVGAGVGTAWWLKQDHQTVVPRGTGVIFSLNENLMIGRHFEAGAR